MAVGSTYQRSTTLGTTRGSKKYVPKKSTHWKMRRIVTGPQIPKPKPKPTPAVKRQAPTPAMQRTVAPTIQQQAVQGPQPMMPQYTGPGPMSYNAPGAGEVNPPPRSFASFAAVAPDVAEGWTQGAPGGPLSGNLGQRLERKKPIQTLQARIY